MDKPEFLAQGFQRPTRHFQDFRKPDRRSTFIPTNLHRPRKSSSFFVLRLNLYHLIVITMSISCWSEPLTGSNILVHLITNENSDDYLNLADSTFKTWGS